MRRGTRVDGVRRIPLSGGGDVALIFRFDVNRLSGADLLFLANIVMTCDRYEHERKEREIRRAERRAAIARWADDGGRSP